MPGQDITGGEMTIRPIAHIKSDFTTKFGVPRQSGLINELIAKIIFTPEYRAEEALRGISEYSNLWLIWGFSENPETDKFQPTVRPPRLGGNTRVGVFATRSPFRPNSLGLSVVGLCGIEKTANDGTVLLVTGADLKDGTPIYDIKPYLPYADSIPGASGSFAQEHKDDSLKVACPEKLLTLLPENKRAALLKVLSLDPRPQYKDGGDRVYGFGFSGFEIRFTVNGGELLVTGIEPAGGQE